LVMLEKVLLSIGHKYVEDSPRLSAIANHFGRTLFEALEKLMRADGRPDFHVPGTLRRQWKMAPHPGEQAVVAVPAEAAVSLDLPGQAVVSVPERTTAKKSPAR